MKKRIANHKIYSINCNTLSIIILIDNFYHLCYIYIEQSDRIIHQVDATN